MKREKLPLGQRVKMGELNGRTVWERRIRESRGEAQIHLRFPVFEGGDGLNALLERLMERYYAFALAKAKEGRPLSAVMRWRWQPREGRVHLTLTGYTGAPENYAPKERLGLVFFSQGTMEFDRIGAKKPKGGRKRQNCGPGC